MELRERLERLVDRLECMESASEKTKRPATASAYRFAADEIRKALREHAMEGDDMEEQAEYGERKLKLCPIMSGPGVTKEILNRHMTGHTVKRHWDDVSIACRRERCAWWTGTECAVVAIAKRGRGVDVLIKPPVVPGL